MEQKFYICAECDSIIVMYKNSGIPIMCCGEKMTEIIPGSVDAVQEKHVPVYEVEGNQVIVTIGFLEHPMEEEHFIACQFIYTC